MNYSEKKMRRKRVLAFLILLALALFCSFNIDNSQASISLVNDAAVEKREVQKKNISPIKVAFVDSNFNGTDIDNLPGRVETYDVVSRTKDDVTRNITTPQGGILNENNNHGTKVLREFVEEYSSLNGEYRPDILLVKISSDKDNEGKVGSARIAKGIEYAADNGAEVINISLGTLQKTKDVLTAIEYAKNKGVIVVAASGNWGEDKKISKQAMSAYAESEGVIAVGAMDEDGKISAYTSGAGNNKLDFLANPRFGSGTSFAAPIVSADAAMVLEGNYGSDEKMDISEVKGKLSDGEKNKFFQIRQARNEV